MCNCMFRSLERKAYNHISATYYLLAERLLRKRNPLKASSAESKQPAACASAPASRYYTFLFTNVCLTLYPVLTTHFMFIRRLRYTELDAVGYQVQWQRCTLRVVISWGAAVVQWLKRQICAQRAWLQFLLVPKWVVGGSRKDTRPKVLQCASKSLSPWTRKSATLNLDDVIVQLGSCGVQHGHIILLSTTLTDGQLTVARLVQ